MIVQGSCECGAVAFDLHGPLRDVVVCHCLQCRKTLGHYWAATSVPTPQLHLRKSESLIRYLSSDVAHCGFCSGCGSRFFYELDGEGRTSVGAGTLDGETGLSTTKHIFIKDKCDYYDIACQAAQIARY